jgi:hypothetical protein
MSAPAQPTRLSGDVVADHGTAPPLQQQHSLSDEKVEAADMVEDVSEGAYISPLEIQARFPTLRHLNEEQMTALNKKVRTIIDWRMMPAVTLMFLMK